MYKQYNGHDASDTLSQAKLMLENEGAFSGVWDVSEDDGAKVLTTQAQSSKNYKAGVRVCTTRARVCVIACVCARARVRACVRARARVRVRVRVHA